MALREIIFEETRRNHGTRADCVAGRRHLRGYSDYRV